MTRTVVRMVALLLGQGPLTHLLLRQVPVRFPVVSGQKPTAFQKPRNEYEIEPQKGRGAHARIRTGDLFLTKEMLYRLSYMGVACAVRFYLLQTGRPDAHDQSGSRQRAAPDHPADGRTGQCRARRRRTARRHTHRIPAPRPGRHSRCARDRPHGPGMAVGSDIILTHRRSDRSPGPRDSAVLPGLFEQPGRGLAPGPRAGQRDRCHRGVRGVAGGEATGHKALTLTLSRKRERDTWASP